MTPDELAREAGITRAEQIAVGAVERCPQCWRDRPLSDFIGARGGFVVMCADCRDRYRNWYKRTPEEQARARRPVLRTGDG